MYCIYCGKPRSPGAPVCENCGHGVNGNAVLEGAVCPSCQMPVPREARFCGNCGRILMAYAPPEGFQIDKNSLLYYRREKPRANEPVQWVTWFDPNTGKYEQVSYPVEKLTQPEPRPAPRTAVQMSAPLPNPRPKPPPAQIPAGFVLDPGSGLYYMAKPGRDPATGADGMWYTWFTPSTGAYRQSFHPSESVGQSTRAPGRSGRSGEKRKMGVLPVVLPLVALLIGAGIAFFQAGGFARFSGPASTEIPQGVPTVSVAPAHVPQFQLAGDGASGAEAAVFLDKTVYLPGEPIQVTVQGVTQQMRDAQAFVAIYAKADDHSEYMEYDYPVVDNDTLFFTAPAIPGSYEVRLYRQDYVYTDESFVTLASFTVEGRALGAAVALNQELMDMIGSANAKLKEINGDTCRSSYLMYGDGMVADYSGSAAPYPVAFWLIGGSYEETMEIWAQESNGGHPVEGKNIWNDQFTISMIEAGGEGLQAVFEGAAVITPEVMNASFTPVGDLYHLAREDQLDYAYEFDIWEGEYQAGAYTVFATFYEKDGERQMLKAMIWRQG